MSLITQRRLDFFRAIAAEVGAQNLKLIVLTHVLPDRPELLNAMNSIAPISLVIGIPYSLDQNALEIIRRTYQVDTPSLDDLLDEHALAAIVRPYLNEGKTCILEIGGYFAPHLETLRAAFGDRIGGFLEDTENGHRKYVAAQPLPYPVYSVARSPLKQAEDALVGPSCVYSAERLLRAQGVLIHPRRALVLGYGKVGRGAALALRGRNCAVSVYDTDAVRMSVALAEGYSIPERATALAEADIIFGCTGITAIKGEDLVILRPGCMLVSCSSKKIEFDLEAMQAGYTRTTIAPNFDRYDREGQIFYLLRDGAPVNFVDGAVIGPALSLVQGEILFGIRQLATASITGSVEEVDANLRNGIAENWLKVFRNPGTGTYRL